MNGQGIKQNKNVIGRKRYNRKFVIKSLCICGIYYGI